MWEAAGRRGELRALGFRTAIVTSLTDSSSCKCGHGLRLRLAREGRVGDFTSKIRLVGCLLECGGYATNLNSQCTNSLQKAGKAKVADHVTSCSVPQPRQATATAAPPGGGMAQHGITAHLAARAAPGTITQCSSHF